MENWFFLCWSGFISTVLDYLSLFFHRLQATGRARDKRRLLDSKLSIRIATELEAFRFVGVRKVTSASVDSPLMGAPQTMRSRTGTDGEKAVAKCAIGSQLLHAK
jgi:hypothetical protein